MNAMTRRRKVKLAAKTGKVMVDHPTVRHAATTVAVPIAKRRVRRRARRANDQLERYGDVARSAGNTLATYGPPAAQALGLYEPPKVKKTAPRVLVGVVIGAAAAFFLDPANGSARRAKLPGGSSAPAESAAYTPPTAAATEPPRTPVA
jgi:hypothetical protein